MVAGGGAGTNTKLPTLDALAGILEAAENVQVVVIISPDCAGAARHCQAKRDGC